MSWSLLEAMACAVPSWGPTPLQCEAIHHGHNGLLVDFFSPNDLAVAVAEVLADRDRAAAFGVAARETVERTYDLDACVTRQLALMDLRLRQYQRWATRQTEPLYLHPARESAQSLRGMVDLLPETPSVGRPLRPWRDCISNVPVWGDSTPLKRQICSAAASVRAPMWWQGDVQLSGSGDRSCTCGRKAPHPWCVLPFSMAC